jgi:hypothetical protein
LIRFWLHFLFLPRLTRRLIVYLSCFWLTVLLRTPMTCCLPMTKLHLGDQVRTLYLYWLIVPSGSKRPSSLAAGNDPFIDDIFILGLRHVPSPLALHDDPSYSVRTGLVSCTIKPINRLTLDYEEP